MKIVMVKAYLKGRWVNVDANDLYNIGDIVKFPKDPNTYRVVNINGSKVTLEVVEE